MRRTLFVLAFALLAGCTGPERLAVEPIPSTETDPTVAVTILQLNDVYEITPVEGGKSGGLARVATLRRRLLAENPNTITVIAGDFYSPSALGTARVDGERINGKQMVAVLNALGLDVATYGNHEFDISEDAFLQRVTESEFVYVTANVTSDEGAAFPNTQTTWTRTFTDADGDSLRLGITGVTLASNPAAYVAYADPLPAMAAAVEALDAETDVIVGLTHLALEDDVRVAAEIPAVDLVLGGHEHENIRVFRGPDFTPVVKADANARTVYVHRLRYDPRDGSLAIDSELVPITDALRDDPEVAAVVRHWVDLGFAGFEASGFEPAEVVTTTTEPLDGREATIRNRPTNLGALIAEAFAREAGEVDLAVFNSGSVRIDDVLPAGAVSQYDVIRVLPFGGSVLAVDVSGAVLARVLDQGLANRGTGGFLQTWNVAQADDGTWRIGGEALDPAATYRIATSDFLVSGNETGLDFFDAETNPDVTITATLRDVRMAVIDELQRRYGAP